MDCFSHEALAFGIRVKGACFLSVDDDDMGIVEQL